MKKILTLLVFTFLFCFNLSAQIPIDAKGCEMTFFRFPMESPGIEFNLIDTDDGEAIRLTKVNKSLNNQIKGDFGTLSWDIIGNVSYTIDTSLQVVKDAYEDLMNYRFSNLSESFEYEITDYNGKTDSDFLRINMFVNTPIICNFVIPVKTSFENCTAKIKIEYPTLGLPQNLILEKISKADLMNDLDYTYFAESGFIKYDIKNPYQTFEFTDDAQESGIFYYRFKFLDLDGSFSYSEIYPILKQCNDSKILMYPNPTYENINLGIEIERAQNFQIEILNELGQTIHLEKAFFYDGFNNLEIQTRKYIPGIYFINVYNELGKIIATERFVKSTN